MGVRRGRAGSWKRGARALSADDAQARELYGLRARRARGGEAVAELAELLLDGRDGAHVRHVRVGGELARANKLAHLRLGRLRERAPLAPEALARQDGHVAAVALRQHAAHVLAEEARHEAQPRKQREPVLRRRGRVVAAVSARISVRLGPLSVCPLSARRRATHVHVQLEVEEGGVQQADEGRRDAGRERARARGRARGARSGAAARVRARAQAAVPEARLLSAAQRRRKPELRARRVGR